MSKATYTFKKGDTLDKIAKANGLKDGDEIWKEPDNKALVKQRGKPDKLQQGDKLVLPEKKPDAAQLKRVVAALQSQLKHTDAQIKHYDSLIETDRRVTQDMVDETKRDLVKMRKLSDEADLAMMFTNLGKALLKIGTVGIKAAGASAKALEEANKEALEAAKDLAKEPAQFATYKIANANTSASSKFVSTAATVVSKVSDYTSPFWWGMTVAKISNGAPIKQSMIDGVGDDLEREMKQTQAESAKRIAIYEAARKHAVQTSALLKGKLKDAEAALKGAH